MIDAIAGFVHGAVENAFVNWAESAASCARNGACSGLENTPEKPTVSSTTTTTVFGLRVGFKNTNKPSVPRRRMAIVPSNRRLRFIALSSWMCCSLVASYTRSLLPNKDARDSLVKGDKDFVRA